MTMKSQYLKDKFESIRDNIEKAENVSKSNPEIASMMSSYLVVFISGIYEDCVEYLFIQRAGKNNDKEIESLVKTFIERQFRNPEYERIKELLGALDHKYKTEFRSKLDIKNIEGINSIVTNKNSVAHGEVSNATLNDINTYHNNAIKIFEELENILL